MFSHCSCSVFGVSDELESDWRILVDPNPLSEDGSVGMGYAHTISNSGQLFVYTLTQSGSDWVSARFLNVTSGTELEDKLEFIKWPDFYWTQDDQGVFYAVS